MKGSYTIKVAEYAVANKIPEELAISCCVKITLKRCNRMVNAIKFQYFSCTHKFGLKIPHSWEEAIFIERKPGTDYWQRAIEKEMEASGHFPQFF